MISGRVSCRLSFTVAPFRVSLGCHLAIHLKCLLGLTYCFFRVI